MDKSIDKQNNRSSLVQRIVVFHHIDVFLETLVIAINRH